MILVMALGVILAAFEERDALLAKCLMNAQ